MTFEALGLDAKLVKATDELGFKNPTPIQEKAIPVLLSGTKDLVGLAQTGTGKTAAFGLPLLQLINAAQKHPQALVVCPTRELCMQIVNEIELFKKFIPGMYVLAVYGGASIGQQIRELKRGVQIVVATPGRLIDLIERKAINLEQIEYVVLDEADEMLNMGFIQDVEKILNQAPIERQTAFFSATMDPSIRKLVTKFLRSPISVTIEQPKAAPTRINQLAYLVPRGWTKARALLPILELEDPDSAIIFVRTRKAAAELTSQLQAAGHSVDEYHGDLSQTQRERLLLRFRQRQVRWIVATDIAARGIHVDDLTHVINYDLPDSVENYVHRIGRTGRAGKEGTALSIVHPLERRKLRDIENHIRQRLEISSIPTRAQIEARQLEKLQDQIREALVGERMASFLPIVAQLAEEYEPHAIAAAALQMAYDQTRPAWIRSSQDAVEDVPSADVPKPKPVKRVKSVSIGKQRKDGVEEVSPTAER